MKLYLLEKAIDQFLTYQVNTQDTEWYFPHAMVSHFHHHWAPPQVQTLHDMYDQCLRSEFSQRWWKRDHYRPKEIMLLLIDADPELASIGWKDLFNDTASLEGRLDRFDYYCNTLLQLHRQKNPRSVQSHHHQDASILSLYLAGMFPEKYSLYPGLDLFRSFCSAIGSPEIPVVDELPRYKKVATIVFTYLQRNEKYEQLIDARQQPFHKVTCLPFQMSYEMIAFEGVRNNNLIA